MPIVGLIVASLAGLTIVLLLVGLLFSPDYTRKKTLAGYAVNHNLYLSLDEKTKVWISMWLPARLKAGDKIPTLLRMERYIEEVEDGWFAKVARFYGYKDDNLRTTLEILDRGFAFVFVQSPGSCQSSGPRYSDYSSIEIDAMGLTIDWVSRQPWSNQKMGVYGGSYSGTTAEMSCAALRPELKAVYSMKPDFDAFRSVVNPGGLGSGAFLHDWAKLIQAGDMDNILGLGELMKGRPLSFPEKMLLRAWIKGLKRPRGADLEIFHQAIQDHRSNPDVEKLYGDLENRYLDTTFPVDDGVATWEDIALYSYKERIEKSQVNSYNRVGWIDAGTAEGVLEKFLTFDTPQRIVITPSGHRLGQFVDLYGTQPHQNSHEPGFKNPNAEMLDYFALHLKDGPGIREQRRVTYFTYGANVWKETDVWPPKGIQIQTLYFGESRSLIHTRPVSPDVYDTYTVDFTASSGEENRWMGQLGRPVKYGDRREEDEKLLYYTSAPLEADLEVTGSPTVSLQVISTHSDGAFHVYLEDVAPDGRVTYLTEGLLRAIHRKVGDPRTAPYVPLGVYHSLRKVDVQPLTPGEVAEISITLLPISVLIFMGHRIRLAIAGHDAALKTRYPLEGIPELHFQRSSAQASYLQLPVMGRELP
ncbi:MAG: CocE/NonD family hydrolase [Candidatus Hodarchaeota archaeon]